MANSKERQRNDQRTRFGNWDQGRRNYGNEQREPYRERYEDQTYPRNFDQAYDDSFSDDNEHYGSGAGTGQWDRFYNEYDPDRYNPNGGRFGHQGQRNAYGGSRTNDSRYGRYHDNAGPGKSYGYNNDIRRDFERDKGYANYGSSEGAGDYLGSRLNEQNRTGESSWFESGRNEGQHKGKGPRGYQRSDERITEDINDRLYDDPSVDATEIEVSVEKGDVILSGSVDERIAKRRAEEIVESVLGVKNVENRIRVNQGLFNSKPEGNEGIGNGSSIAGGSNPPFGKSLS